jgi:hypothetical protein
MARGTVVVVRYLEKFELAHVGRDIGLRRSGVDLDWGGAT